MYLRRTTFRPSEGQARPVRALVDGYLAWLKLRPGFILGLRLSPREERQTIVRLTVWTDRSAADATALTDHSLSVRSFLMTMMLDQAIHEEEYDVDTVEPLSALSPVAPASESSVPGRHLLSATFAPTRDPTGGTARRR